jgi:hypothetical protein
MNPGMTIHRLQCAAAAATGCTSDLVWEDHLDTADYVNERLAELNGWRKDHGQWICRNHPGPS